MIERGKDYRDWTYHEIEEMLEEREKEGPNIFQLMAQEKKEKEWNRLNFFQKWSKTRTWGKWTTHLTIAGMLFFGLPFGLYILVTLGDDSILGVYLSIVLGFIGLILIMFLFNFIGFCIDTLIKKHKEKKAFRWPHVPFDINDTF